MNASISACQLSGRKNYPVNAQNQALAYGLHSVLNMLNCCLSQYSGFCRLVVFDQGGTCGIYAALVVGTAFVRTHPYSNGRFVLSHERLLGR